VPRAIQVSLSWTLISPCVVLIGNKDPPPPRPRPRPPPLTHTPPSHPGALTVEWEEQEEKERLIY